MSAQENETNLKLWQIGAIILSPIGYAIWWLMSEKKALDRDLPDWEQRLNALILEKLQGIFEQYGFDLNISSEIMVWAPRINSIFPLDESVTYLGMFISAAAGILALKWLKAIFL